jgi:hypothetical protein
MRAFACPACDRLVTFESTRCLHCATELRFDPRSRSMRAVGTGEACALFRCSLHIRDTLQSAAAYGVRVDGPSIPLADSAPLHSEPTDTAADVSAMLEAWIPMTYALNAISRSMGALELYPFILTAEIAAKLALIDALVKHVAA